jgi:hypothetical protein
MHPKLDSGLAIQGRYGLTAAAVEPSDSTAPPSYKDALRAPPEAVIIGCSKNDVLRTAYDDP